ncbi:MAG TPA: alanine--tRNA ligase [Verrucomicrobiae bacterium]|nr:alanine--tRNA ligase [Verrucomicrobiae bacterium]
MTSVQIRQSFLDFFKSKQHTIVPSSSLMPDSPNLLFTNAGMNQFVPIFLGQTKCPYTPGRAADTQKCIRAGGKHNDLDDVGLDTYHHTFFEMLGNWSFGDYFKKEAIDWAWELVVEKWKFPPSRLYATVYSPDKSKNDPSEFDQDAWNFWAEKFRSVDLDPKIHIVNGNKKDNFWMMGETGPCGPCSELHVDLTQNGDTQGALVNKGSSECIEIWNLVFIQFNANPDGTFSPLPAKHVDTGMGFERVTSILQCTKNFTNFGATISNYETDIFRPIFDAIEKLSGKKYGSTLPASGTTGNTKQEKIDIAFRVIADHIRTLSFAIADGIQPGNNDRNYVLRRILRRAMLFGRTLGFHEPFLYKLVDVLADTMGEVFSEIRAKKKHVQEVIKREEEMFNQNLDKGLQILEMDVLWNTWINAASKEGWTKLEARRAFGESGESEIDLLRDLLGGKQPAAEMIISVSFSKGGERKGPFSLVQISAGVCRDFLTTIPIISGEDAFRLHDTYGFPVEETERLARERGLTVDKVGFRKLMDEQRARARAAQKKEVISLSVSDITTEFVGFDSLEADALVVNTHEISGKSFAIVNRSPLYAEMGGQVGDTGKLSAEGKTFTILNTVKKGQSFYLQLDEPLHLLESDPRREISAHLTVDKLRRNAIQRHHTVTHLLHWALHEVASKEASQKGSFVGPDKLTFDFNSPPLTPSQVADIEKLVNEKILENTLVSWTEVPHADVKNRKDVMQFFGDKYGDTVRVVQIGGQAHNLNGYSMELCGGTHVRATGEIGLFRIVGESAIAAGVRRIEAVAGLEAYNRANDELHLIKTLAGKVNSPVHELEKKIESLLERQKELEREIKIAMQRNASNAASELLERMHTVNGIPFIAHNLGVAEPDFLQAIADALKGRFQGVIVLGGHKLNAVTLICAVTPEYTSKIQAGKIIQQIAPIVGGKGGGKPDNARGGGRDSTKLDEALAKAKALLES